MDDNAKKSLTGLTLDQLKDVAAEVGLKPFAAKQMAAWLYQRRVTSIDSMTDLSKSARERLNQSYVIGRQAPKSEARSKDGTVKYLFDGANGRDIEAVCIPDRDRATLCVSCQAGCRMGCTFCMTGRFGLNGNLTAGQIINQVLSVPESEDLTNIVFMGMGEPTDNLQAVLTAIEILTAPWGLAWSPRRITLSTIGNIDALREIIEKTQVHIAVSAHSPFPAERAAIMPVERAFPLNDVIDFLRRYDFAHQRRLSIEYIMWDGFNDGPRHAGALGRILEGTDARVNLIRYHALPDDPRQPASTEAMETFRDRLNARGITATIRASRGQDIDAACGQLSGKNINSLTTL